MNKTVLLILTGTLALLAEGCSFFSDFADARKEIEENSAKPIPVKVNTSETQTSEVETDAEIADLEQEAEPIQEIAGLISATNPDVRVRSIVRGRQDPFSTVTLTPRIEIEEEEKPINIRPNQVNRTNREQSRLSQPSDDDLLQPPFEPTLAQNVIVSGFYEANGKAKLIVQAPEETTSRYVEVGQYLSNGQVLVKSIDLNHFPTPLVVLEQSGIEVSKVIGETPEDSRGSRISSLPIENSHNKTLLSNASLSLK